MTKKHEMNEQEYRTYKKQHDYEDAVAVEEEKIRREHASYAQQRRKSETRLRQQLRGSISPDDLEEVDDDVLDLPEEHIAERVRRNARTHKRRLVGLRKHEE